MGHHHKPDRMKAQTDTNLFLTHKLEERKLEESRKLRHSDTDSSQSELRHSSRVQSLVGNSVFTTRPSLRESATMKHPIRSIGLPRLPEFKSR